MLTEQSIIIESRPGSAVSYLRGFQMRLKDEILIDIIEASEDYRAVVDVANRIRIDYDTDAPGVPEVLMDMKDHLYSLYKEMLAVIKAERECIDI